MEIKIFEKKEFGSIRAIEIDNEPYFVGKDVATVLGYTNQSEAINEHVDDDDRKVLTFKAYSKTLQASLWQGNDFSDKTLINESGVYSLILSSKLPTAKQFKRWVTSEVLPSIRKKGMYSVPTKLSEALRLAAEQAEIIEKQAELIAIQTPKADYYDALIERENLTCFRDTAKQIGIGQKEFIDWIIKHRYIFRNQKNQIRPYIDYCDKYFKAKDFIDKDGKHAGVQVLITTKGKEHFAKRLKEEAVNGIEVLIKDADITNEN